MAPIGLFFITCRMQVLILEVPLLSGERHLLRNNCFSQLSMEEQLNSRESWAGPRDETGSDRAAARLPRNVFALKQGGLHRDNEMKCRPNETSFHAHRA